MKRPAHVPTSRTRPVRPRLRVLAAGLLACALAAPPLPAALPEPDHSIYGTPRIDGVIATAGTVTLEVNGDAEPIASYDLGSDPGLGVCDASSCFFALRAPVDVGLAGETRQPGSARPGDDARLYLDGQLAAEGVIGAAGEAQLLDVDTSFLPQIPSLSVADAAGAESLAGPFGLDVEVTLRLSFAIDDPVTVDWQTVDGTASAGSDYAAAAGVATFAPGETLATVEVTLFDDADAEADPAQALAGESFFVQLSNPIEANLLDAAGTVTIVDDDTPPALAVANLSVVEPPVDAVERAFSVSLSYPWDQDVTFDYSGVDGTAGSGDFELAAGSATIPAGSLTTEIGVRILADGLPEDDETFELVLASPVGASLRDDRGQGTILESSRFLTFVERQRNGEAGAGGLLGAIDVALSPGGEHLYAAGRGDDAVTVFARDAATGRLSFITAYRDGEGGLEDLGGVEAVAVSPNGERLYAAAFDDGALAVFSRDPAAGTLTLIEVEREGARDLESGDTVEGLDGAIALAVADDSAGGEHVYVAGSTGDALAVFHRDATSGLVSFEEVQKDDPGVNGLNRAVALAVSPDGAQLYVASLEDDSVAVFDRDAGTGRLTFVEAHFDGGANDGLAGAAAVAVAPDGTSVYVAGQADNGLAVFDRAPDGTLTFREALISGAGGVSGLAIATDVAVSADGAYVYASGFADDALAVFERAVDGSLTPLEVELDGEAGIDGLAGATALAVSADDGQVYATGTLDDAVSVFRRDLTAPSDPGSVASTSHQVGVFSPLTVIDVEWSGATDLHGHGVAGYWALFDEAPGTLPATAAPSVFVPHGLDPTAIASAALADSAGHYFHLRTCDQAGNCTSTVHLGPFGIDATPPSAPSALASPSHGLAGAPSNVPAVEVAWSAAVDGLSGLRDYGYAFDPNPAWTCDFAQTLPAGALGNTGPALAEGIWYFHLCAADVAGNPSPVATAGSFVIDLTEPSNPPLLASTSHQTGEWSSDATIDVEWSGAADTVGLDGYSFLFDAAVATVPDGAVDQAHGADPQTATSPVLADGDSQFFHLRSCDLAGNCALALHLGPFSTDATPPAAPAALLSSSHAPGVASSDVSVDVAWDAAVDATSGVAGYAWEFAAGAWACDGVQDAGPAGLSTTSPALADGSWTFYLCALDLAGNLSPVASLGPFVIETQAPVGTVAASTSHAEGTWSNDPTIVTEWSGTTDPNGVAGYSFVFDAAAGTVPDEVIDLAHGSDPHSAASAPLADGDGYYFHLLACDTLANCGTAIHLGPYRIETVPPSPVTGLVSTSHPTDDTSTAQVVDLEWDASTDATSGLAGYAVGFDENAAWTCDQVEDVAAGTTEFSSAPLLDGTWYAHVCAGDDAGNWTAAATAGPYVISTDPATVTLVTTVADTGDGELTAGERTTLPITQLYVDFSRPMADPAGDGSTVDVTNPTSYLLVADGGDRVVDTADCAGVDPTDLGVPVDHVDYASTPRRATLWLDSVVPLPAARYRLFGCAGGLHDEVGTPLDGDGDGTGGDDFSRDFEVLITNQLLNPNFDLDLGSWLTLSPVPGDVAHDSEDADALITSGSARIANTSGAIDEPFAISQCLAVTETDLLLRARARVDSVFAVDPAAFALAEFFLGGACTEAAVGSVATDPAVADSGGEWLGYAVEFVAPAGAGSALVSFTVEGGEATAFDVFYDVLFFGDSGLLFADGFESGDVSAWSNSTP